MVWMVRMGVQCAFNHDTAADEDGKWRWNNGRWKMEGLSLVVITRLDVNNYNNQVFFILFLWLLE